jgi:hypothetical protein
VPTADATRGLADEPELRAALTRLDSDERPERPDLRLVVKHSLAVLAARAPGRAVEVRVPPFAAVQVLGGPRHGRGTPPAVVETDPATWIALSRGRLSWHDAVGSGRLRASGVRSDLSALLPLIDLERETT